MDEKDIDLIGKVLDGNDNLIKEYEKHIEGYMQLVDALNIRIRELENKNETLEMEIEGFKSDVERMYERYS
jgi:predicted RNase H-like nuclease (RuvC/YqgF family)